MNVDIIIPSCKDKGTIEPLVATIRQTAVTDCRLIIISARQSAAVNRNAGLEKSNADYVIMVDDDVEGFEKGWDANLVQRVKDNLNVGIVSARLLKPDKTPGIMCDNPYEPSAQIQVTHNIPTACVAFRKTGLRFDETYIGSSWEDTDFCKQWGKPHLIDNTIKVIHKNEAKNQDKDVYETNSKYFNKKWSGDFKFIAIYKTLCGGEWLSHSLRSVCHYVDKVIMVHANNMWGQKGVRDNNCMPVVQSWKNLHGNHDKFLEVSGTFKTQTEQYNLALLLARSLYADALKDKDKNVYAFIIDTDEVWDSINIQKLMGHVISEPGYDTYHCRMRTYIKSPLYRITPSEACRPVVVVNLKMDTGKDYGPRFSHTIPSLFLDDVYMHHFTMVRTDIEDIKDKLKYSAFGDGTVSHADWFEKTWSKIPNVTNFHYSKGMEDCWKGLEIIDREDLPYVVRNDMETFIPSNGG